MNTVNMFLLLWLMLKCRYLSTCVKICHGFPHILMLQYTTGVSVTLTSALVQLPLHSFINHSSTTVILFYTLYYIPPPYFPHVFWSLLKAANSVVTLEALHLWLCWILGESCYLSRTCSAHLRMLANWSFVSNFSILALPSKVSYAFKSSFWHRT